MKQTFIIEGLACAHCAAEIEDGIRKLDGVQDASLNFMTQKLVIDAADEAFDAVLKKAARICKRVEPGSRMQALEV